MREARRQVSRLSDVAPGGRLGICFVSIFLGHTADTLLTSKPVVKLHHITTKITVVLFSASKKCFVYRLKKK